MDIFDDIFVDGATNIFGTVFAYTVSDAPLWTIAFTGNESREAVLDCTVRTADLQVVERTADLVVTTRQTQ